MNKEQFRALSTKKRIMYVLSHVFWHGALAVIVCALAWAYVYEEYIWQPPLLNVEMIDAGRKTPDGEAFEAFLREEGCWGQGQRVDVSKAFQLGDEETDLKCNPGILLTCNILAEKTDLYFWDTNELEDQLKERALMDLREILPHRMLLEHAEDLVYTGPLLEGGYPCGIRLTHNSWIQKNQYYEQCMVGVSRTTKNMKMVRAFLEYLLRPDEMPGEIRPAHM